MSKIHHTHHSHHVNQRRAPERHGGESRPAPAQGLGLDRVDHAPARDDLRAARDARHAGAHGGPTVLAVTADQGAAISRGEHQIHTVANRALVHPSENLAMIESQRPFEHGQTHVTAKHIGETLADNVERLKNEPHIKAAGGFRDEASAQFAVDTTIANPANQEFIGKFLADPQRYKDVLFRVDFGRPVGDSVTRADLNAGHPRMIPSSTATVVVIKDPSFPEKYRVLTAFPEATRPPQVDASGKRV